MLATVGTKRTVHQRVKSIIVVTLFALSLGSGIAAATQHVGAQTYCYYEPTRGKVCTVVK